TVKSCSRTGTPKEKWSRLAVANIRCPHLLSTGQPVTGCTRDGQALSQNQSQTDVRRQADTVVAITPMIEKEQVRTYFCWATISSIFSPVRPWMVRHR